MGGDRREGPWPWAAGRCSVGELPGTAPLAGKAAAVLADGEPSLVIYAAPDPSLVGQRFPLRGDVCRIGRAPGNDVVLEGCANVSRNHCVVERVGEGWVLRDLQSRNGTFLNECRIAEHSLRVGDFFQLGEVVIRFVDGREAGLLDTLKTRVMNTTREELHRRLPYPLVAFEPLVRARADALGRVRLLIQWIETVLRFVVAVEISWLRERSDPALRDALERRLLAVDWSRKVSMGVWQQLAWQLAEMLPTGGAFWADAFRRVLCDPIGGPSSLSNRLSAVVQFRNELVHTAVPLPEVCAEQERMLLEVIEDLLVRLAPLAGTQMVSLCEARGFVRPGVVGYRFWHHVGAGGHPVIEEGLPKRFEIQPRWCYLLGDSGSEPLFLAPFFAAVPCKQCPTVEVVVAQEFPTPDAGTPVDLVGVVTGHPARVSMPYFSPNADDLHRRMLHP